MPKCPDCNDRGVIELLTSTQVCACRSESKGSDEPVCHVPMHSDPALHRDRAPGHAHATFTLEVDVGGDIRTFTDLSKAAVDFVHAGLRAGWDAARVADHLDEMATAAKVQERSRRLADLEAAGFPEHEIEEVAETIETRLFSVEDDGEAVKIIMEEIAGLILRKTIRSTLSHLIPNVQELPKGQATFAKGGIVSGERFRQQCGFSFVPETCGGTIPSDRKAAKAVITPIMATGQGKAELFKRMYGGKPNLAIDTSEVEARLMAHLCQQEHERAGFNNPEFRGFPHVPRPDGTPPHAG